MATLPGMKPQFSAHTTRAQGVACFVWGALTVWLGAASAQTQAVPGTPPSTPTLPAANPKAEAAPTFDMLEFAVEGNTVLPVGVVERAVTPFLGPNKTFADVEAARAALEKTYQDAGFLTVFVDLPEQSTAEGVIRLSVQEGRIERLSVTGSRYFSQGYIRHRVSELAQGRVPNFNVVQAQLGEVNRTDDRRVQPVLKPGRSNGTVDAELQVTDQAPLHASFELNNEHAQFTTPWRLRGTLRYDNLFQRDHTLALTAITAPADTKQSSVLSADYTVPVDGGDSWRYSFLYSDSNIQALGSATILGKGHTVGVNRQWTLPSTPSVTHSLSLGADYKDMKEQTKVGSDSLSTPIRYMPFTLAYTGALQNEDGASTNWSANSVFGFKRLIQHNHDCGFGSADQFECKREGADGGFAYLRLDLRHSEPVSNWRINGRVGGQIATQALLGAEQYALGGADSVRGYLSAEAVGDNALLGSLDVQTPNLAPSDSSKDQQAASPSWYGVTDLRAYAFADGGRVRIINASAGQAASQILSSIGLGLKLKSRKYMNLTVEWAVPMKAAVATEKQHPHTHMALGLDF